MECKSNVWIMFVAKWGGTVSAQVVSCQAEWQRLMKNKKVSYVCSDRYGYDLYEHNETGELYATKGNLWGQI